MSPEPSSGINCIIHTVTVVVASYAFGGADGNTDKGNRELICVSYGLKVKSKAILEVYILQLIYFELLYYSVC
jgi:hypothetical protein